MKVQKYIPYKLGRREDAYHKDYEAVPTGKIFGPSTAAVYDYENKKQIKAEKLIPVIGQAVWIQGRGMMDYVRTSTIEDFYIHEDYENSKDKIVLKPENAFLLDKIRFSPGDVLLVTMNSLYFLKAE